MPFLASLQFLLPAEPATPEFNKHFNHDGIRVITTSNGVRQSLPRETNQAHQHRYEHRLARLRFS